MRDAHTKHTKAVALCRVSTSKQRIYGNSLEAQELRILNAAEQLNVLLPDENIWRMDISSRKGKNLKRKDLLQIKDRCKQDRHIRYFIVDEPDRFMRSIKEFYWWKVEFELIGVELRFAHKPLASDDDQHHVFDELIDVYRAESSNQERSKKANEKMQARIDQGYYPGYCHTGYKKTDTKGLHTPKEPQFSLLQTAYKDVAYGRRTMREALTWLYDNGFRLDSGKRFDMTKFKRILREPYYYGAVKMGSFTVNEKGLHEPMVSKDEFEIAERIARGLKARFTINRHNPEFPMNGLICENCFVIDQNNEGKFTGYKHHNGKPPARRKYYTRYRCRGCGMPFTRDEMHGAVDSFLSKVSLDPSAVEQLKKSLRQAWTSIENDRLNDIKRTQTQLDNAESQKTKIVISLVENPDLAEDLREALEQNKKEISDLKNRLLELDDVEQDFLEFVDFALSYVENLKSEWWDLNHDDRLRCEQLIFPQYLRVSKSKKVSTPEISCIYRYGTTQKAPEGALNAISGGPGET